jgi:hypothetical protein
MVSERMRRPFERLLGQIDEAEQESSQPSSFANGRFPVKIPLGEGGKKRVRLAQDREMAPALIDTEGPATPHRLRPGRGRGPTLKLPTSGR